MCLNNISASFYITFAQMYMSNIQVFSTSVGAGLFFANRLFDETEATGNEPAAA